ncbi:MAG: hypothetical protein HYU66_08695 [Armatimonadetes bacterium]|nr:hypothetical protein [Armatimonadota bacterium]
MPGRLIVRVTPDQRVEVQVEGLAAPDAPRARGEKLCELVTRRLEQALGAVESRDYEAEAWQPVEVQEDQALGQEGG